MSPTRPIAALGAALLVLTLGACASASSAEPQADPAGETRTVESTYTGEQVEVPAHPQRVLALWRTGTELAELGVVPVGALDGEFTPDELGDLYDAVSDVPVVGTYEGADIEKVIAAKPDLIVGMDHGGLGIDYDELAQVAPTVILKIAEPTDVWANYPALADVVGKSSDFTDRNADLDASLAAIQQEYGEALADLQVTHLNAAEGLWVSTSKSLAYQRLVKAGFGYNPGYVENPERYVTELATENLPDLADQDAIFYSVALDGTVDPALQAVLDSESFQRLPAAQAGHVFPLTSPVIYTFDAADAQVADLETAAKTLVADR